MDDSGRRRPPRLLTWLAHLLLRGRHGPYVRQDLAESFDRDVAAGRSGFQATRRYATNLLGSAWSLARGGTRRVFMRGMLLDAKLGMRMLLKQPMLTFVALLALGLGIPSSLILHHAMEVILRPFPVPDGERVMGIRYWDLEARQDAPASLHDLETWGETLTAFETLAAVRPSVFNVNAGDPGTPPVRGAEVTPSFFRILGGAPLVGRALTAEDQAPAAPDVVVIGEDLWSGRFGRDPDVVGSTVRIGRREHTVVGVMAEDFRYPYDETLWLPLRARAAEYAVGEGPGLFVFGRLAEGVLETEADAELELVTERLVERHPKVYEHRVGQVVPISLLLLGEAESIRNDPEILLIQSILMAFLLIVCGNVGTLILARTATRSSEISVRTALGASRGRIVTQIFVESLVLSLVATALGLALAETAARWLMEATGPEANIPFWLDFTPGPRIVMTAFGLAAACAAVAGVIPALKATRSRVQENLQRASTGSTMRFGWGSTVLIVSEVVLAVGFLAMGGTLVRSVFQDTEGQLGFNPDRYLYAQLRVPWVDPTGSTEGADLNDGSARLSRTQADVLRRLIEHPDVRAAALGMNMPGASTPDRPVILETAEDDGVTLPVQRALVDVGFFEGLGQPILAGRDFTAADADVEPRAHRAPVIVNTRFVDEVLGGRNALGVRFREVTPPDTDEASYEWFEVVGVVGPFGMNATNPLRDAGIYHPMVPGEHNPVRFLVETVDDPAGFAPTFRSVVAGVDPEATVENAEPLHLIMERESRILRWIFSMQVVLAAVAFLLSVTGLYALMSFTVSQRRREIGVRQALGARPWSIISTIARRAAVQLGLGLGLGAVWAWRLLGEVQRESFTVPLDIPATVAVTVACAGLVGVLACVSPTLRGLRIQPVEAMGD